MNTQKAIIWMNFHKTFSGYRYRPSNKTESIGLRGGWHQNLDTGMFLHGLLYGLLLYQWNFRLGGYDRVPGLEDGSLLVGFRDEAPVAGLGKNSPESWSTVQTMFTDFDCRNDQHLKILHDPCSDFDQYVSRWGRRSDISGGLNPCRASPPPTATFRALSAFAVWRH